MSLALRLPRGYESYGRLELGKACLLQVSSRKSLRLRACSTSFLVRRGALSLCHALVSD